MLDSKDLTILFEVGSTLSTADVKSIFSKLREKGLVNNRGGLSSRGSRVREMLLELANEYTEEF